MTNPSPTPNAEAEATKNPDEPKQEADNKIRIELDFDMASNQLTMKSQAPTVMILGILAMAQSMVTQNQVLQRLQAMAAKPKIIQPGRH